MSKRFAMPILLSVLTVICGCNENLIRVSFEQFRFSPKEPGVVKAMTFNIRVDTFLDRGNSWKSRKRLVFDVLRKNSADVIGLQEALDSQLKEIKSAMPYYGLYYAGRNDGGKEGESCAILYRKNRYRMIDSGTFWFSDTPDKPGSKDWGNIPPRICSWVHLAERGTGKRMYVYNVHLDNLSQNSRRKSVRLLAKKVAARKTDDPFIVMGDFNMELDNPAMEYLQQERFDSPYPRMVDAWQSLNPGRTGIGTRHGFKGNRSGPTIDHIPINEGSLALDVKYDLYNVDGKYPSDHFPVIARILLGESPSKITAKKPTKENGPI